MLQACTVILNVRELENVMRRAAVFAREEVTPSELPAPMQVT